MSIFIRQTLKKRKTKYTKRRRLKIFVGTIVMLTSTCIIAIKVTLPETQAIFTHSEDSTVTLTVYKALEQEYFIETQDIAQQNKTVPEEVYDTQKY